MKSARFHHQGTRSRASASVFRSRVRQGQTLVIALIILFVLMVIGFLFIAILNRNIVQTNTARQRTVASDLADAGIQYIRDQLLNNPLGADYRPDPTVPLLVEDNAGNIVSPVPNPPTEALYSQDPDLYWIRPASLQVNLGGKFNSSGFDLHTGDLQPDMGGPDGLGPFSRINFKNGRALVRVRYAPSDVDVTQASESFGPLRQPGRAHDFIIIESVGRPGALNPNDPTSVPTVFNVTPSVFLNPRNGVEYQGFNAQNDLQGAVALSSELDSQWVHSRKLLAFASIGIIDDALFITNIHHSATPAELGRPYEIGAQATDDSGAAPQDVHVPEILGAGSNMNVKGPTPYSGGGSVYVNDDVLLEGSMVTYLNAAFGESFDVNGTITGVGSIKGGAPAQILIKAFTGANTTELDTTLAAGGGMDSADANYSTLGGFYRDGFPGTDAALSPRGVPYRTPPDILHADPTTGLNRWYPLTRDSGAVIAAGAGNSGQYGHGRGVYVNNSADLQIANDESGRMAAGAADALFYDWLNPNNTQANSAWQGPYYVPPAAYVQLRNDGFDITLNSLGPAAQRTWKRPDGTDSSDQRLKFRVGGPAPGYIIDSLTPGISNIDNPTNADFLLGQPFNGVLFFEGNVRIRGVIPNNFPLTVVSMGNIYIEGSITKGVQDSQGNVLQTPPQTGIALLARDYVVVNTTQFFGPGPSPVTEKNSGSGPTGYNSVIMSAADGEINLLKEFLLDPEHAKNGGQPGMNPQNWPIFPGEYMQPGSGTPIQTQLMVADSMDDGPAANATVSLDVDEGTGAVGSWDYLFGGSPIYQLGQNSWQVYSNFESVAFPFLTPTNPGQGAPPIDASGNYTSNLQQSTAFRFHPNATPLAPASNDYLLARSAVVPDDIRIEAVMYAQEGSFFVIPGEWFNPNASDQRSAYNFAGGGNALLQRMMDFGTGPFTPFYGEPLDVKITILGSINENMPAPISQQAEWLKKWGWIPREHGASGELIPTVHVPQGFDVTNNANPQTYLFVPNIILKYDPVLATGRANGYDASNPQNLVVRHNPQDPTGLSMLPPMPCLPVSPSLFYFGEVNP